MFPKVTNHANKYRIYNVKYTLLKIIFGDYRYRLVNDHLRTVIEKVISVC